MKIKQKKIESNDSNITASILKLIPSKQIKEVFNQDYCEINHEFVGFVEIYKSLSVIIPKHFTVIDLGCAYNPQCFYFSNHRKYVAVDSGSLKRFKTENCEIYEMRISDFIQQHISDFDLDRTFAICSYVPPWGADNMKLVRDNFENVFTYYPCQDEKI